MICTNLKYPNLYNELCSNSHMRSSFENCTYYSIQIQIFIIKISKFAYKMSRYIRELKTSNFGWDSGFKKI